MVLQNTKKALVKQGFEACKKHSKIPYKTCGIPMILEPKWQKGIRNDQKALGFSLKVEGVLRPCEMSKKHWS